MWRETRYDLQDLSELGLAPALSTYDSGPATPSGEQLVKKGGRLYINAHHLSSQVFGNSYSCPSRAEMDAWLDKQAAAGVNAFGVMGSESFGRVHSGAQAGRQLGCFDLGYLFSSLTTRNWTVGDVIVTTDGSGVRRVYECTAGGVWSGASTGPTVSSGSQTAGATFLFKHIAGSVYSEEFFAGSTALGSAGFDYFVAATGRRGQHIYLRFNVWDLVISGQTGYPLNGGGNLGAMLGVWPFDGEYNTPQVRTIMRNHIARFLDRVNTVNGLRYGDDPTLLLINPWNEMGIAYWFYNSTNASSPSGNTFDRMCFQGSSTSANDPANPTALYVAAWDSKFAAWYTATFGTTPAADYGKLNTLPCNGYGPDAGGGAMGSNVAARNTYRVGATGNDYAWRKRVNRFLRETEATMVRDMQTWLRTKSAHVLQLPGQSSWMFISSFLEGDLCGIHYYTNGTDTSSNTLTLTATSAPTAGMAYSAANGGTISFTGMPSTDTAAHPLAVGAWVRWTLSSNPSITGISQIATLGDPWTVTGVGADPGIGGTNVNCSVIIGTADKTYNEWQYEPPADTSPTRTHVWLAGSSAEVNSDASQGWLGNANYGNLTTIRSPQLQLKPRYTSELGNRAVNSPSSSFYHVLYNLFDLLLGGSGAARFAWITSTTPASQGEHNIAGDGSAMLSTALVSLMARYISPFPTEDATQVTADDIDDWYSKKNTTDGYGGNSAGWAQLVNSLELSGQDSQWHAFMHARLRTKIAGSSAKTDISYTHAASGWTHPELNNPYTVGRLYHNRNIGTVVYENPKIAILGGRFRATTDETESSFLSLNALDGYYWQGLVGWASLDGSDLGCGRSVLFHWLYPRAQGQQFRRHSMAARVQQVEMLDGDQGPSTGGVPGVVLRNGLEITLVGPKKLAAWRLSQRSKEEYLVAYRGGRQIIQPQDPLILLAPAATDLLTDVRRLLLLPDTKASVHAADSVVSTSAGRLIAFMVVTVGTATMTLYDNPSAGSGTVRKTVPAAEMPQGALVYCGPEGIELTTGGFIAFTGGTAPVLVAIFRGTYPAVSYTGSERWFDGTAGNDAWNGQAPYYQGGVTGPRKTFNNQTENYNSGAWRFYFKRGTEVEQWRNGGGSFALAGTNIYFGAYGDASLPKPVIFKTQATQDSGQQFDLTATSGNLRVEDLRFEFRGAAKGTGSFMAAMRGLTVHFERVESHNYTNAFTLGGNYSRVVDCVSTSCSQGVLSGASSGGWATPNYSLVFRHLAADCSADAFSIHDGTGNGVGTVVLGSVGNPGTESFLDVQPQYTSGLFAFNVGVRAGAATTFGVGLDTAAAGAWSLIGNQLIDLSGRGTLLMRGNSLVVVGNYLEGYATNTGGLVTIEPSATNAKIWNNVLVQGASATNNLINFAYTNANGSSGSFSNNIVICLGGAGVTALTLWSATTAAAWAMNGNDYWMPNGARLSDGTTVHSTVAAFFSAVRPGKEALGQNVDPVLLPSYKPAESSALLRTGVTPSTLYLGPYGPLWASAPGAIGLAGLAV